MSPVPTPDMPDGSIMPTADPPKVRYGIVKVHGLDVFYREAGRPDAPKLVLLHGFPGSSFYYRELMPALADRFHVIAPDYPGFGNSSMPDPAQYSYSFEATSQSIEAFLAQVGFARFGLYMQDYGGPVGFRIIARRPEWLEWLIVQNTNAYDVGFTDVWSGMRSAYWINKTPENEKPLEAFLEPETVKAIYLHGHPKPELISPDAWLADIAGLARPNAHRVQLDFFYDYRKNVELYPEWQTFLRKQQPRAVIFWGQGDIFFTPAGGEAFLHDLPKAEIHRLNSGHFAVEDSAPYIAHHIKLFYDKNVRPRI